MMEIAKGMRTLETAAATIQFGGGVADGNDSDSSSEEEVAKAPSNIATDTCITQDNRGDILTEESRITLCDDAQITEKHVVDNVNSREDCMPVREEIKKPRDTPPRYNPFDKDTSVDNFTFHHNEADGLDGGVLTRSTGSHVGESSLGMTEDHFSLPEDELGSVEALEWAIAECKQHVLEATPHTDLHHQLVQRLVALRLKLTEVKETPDETNPDKKMVVGHTFQSRDDSGSQHYCEKCNSVIWSLLHRWYRCSACGFCCHAKCLNLITRACASVKIIENPTYITSICPERGLAVQGYKCAECKAAISFQNGFGEPRQCDYTGNFYCEMCHWNDTVVVPARVLHNWDFETRKVCRASKQLLRLLHHRAVIRIQDINPMLFNYVEELNQVKKLREEILIMKRYFLHCKDALDSKLLLQLQERQHFVESSDMYSLQDITDVALDILLPLLARIHSSFAQHIKTDCELCRGKGYCCELCDQREVLFPFDTHAIVCSQCSTVLHRHCFMRRQQQCPKCRRQQKSSSSSQDDMSSSSRHASSDNPS